MVAESVSLQNDLYSREPAEYRNLTVREEPSFCIRELLMPSTGLAYVTDLI